MPLLSFGAELIDVTEGADGVMRGADATPVPSNVERFQRIIAAAHVDYDPDNPGAATRIPGKILYLPEGRYRIENRIPDAWSNNFWDSRASYRGTQRTDRLRERIRNPFGASLRITADLTLWLAPGAVLVPDEGCIIHLQCALVCERTKIFDLSNGGLIVFGENTPKVLPEWWGAAPGRDSADAIQHAIDAAIHHRYNVWEYPASDDGGYVLRTTVLPLIPIELRGEYQLGHTIEVRGGVTTTRLFQLLGSRGVQNIPNGDVFLPPQTVAATPTVVIEVLPDDRTRYFTEITALNAGPGAPTVTAVTVDVAGVGPRSGGRRVVVQSGYRVGVFLFVLTLNEGAPLTLRVVIDPVVRGRREVLIVPTTTMGGVWQGRAAQGARLTATTSFVGSSLLRLTNALGFTLRDVILDVGNLRAPNCLEIIPQQGMAVRRCQFIGQAVTLVQLGPAEELLPGDPGAAPVAIRPDYNTDATGLSFDECTFLPTEGGVGCAVRAGNSVPFRFRDCSFIGQAAAMIKAAIGTFLADRCFFDNSGFSPPTGPFVPGFEPPDGADVYMTYEARQAGTAGPPGTARPTTDYHGTVSALTMSACVSRSQRLLSAPSAFNQANIVASLDWPVVLLNTRHLPRDSAGGSVSIQWGLRGRPVPATIRFDDRPGERLGYQPPLLVLGGQYGGSLRVLPGATPCAFVGPRNLRGGLMPVELVRVTAMAAGFTQVFSLPIDQRYSLSP